MKKILSIAVALALLSPHPAIGESGVAVRQVALSNLYSQSDGGTQVLAGVELPSRDLLVSSVGEGRDWSLRISVGASHQFPIHISVVGDKALVVGRKHPSGGFAALIENGEPVWVRDFYELRSGALYESGDSVVVGYDIDTQNARASFVTYSGSVFWENEFVRDFPTAFEWVDAEGDLVYLRGRSRCGESSACDAVAATAIMLALDRSGNVVNNADILLSDLFGTGSDFRNVYPWLTVSGAAPHPDGGWALSGLGMKSDTGQECLLLARLLSDFSVDNFSGPIFCDEGQDLYENRGAVFVTQSGNTVVSVGSYYELSVAGPTSGATDFVVAVVSSDGNVVYQTQFGSESTDHPNSIHVFDGKIFLSGNNSQGGVNASIPFLENGYHHHAANSPDWVSPEEVILPMTPSAPATLSLSRSATHIQASWSAPESEGGAPIERYIAVAYDTGGAEAGSCIGRTYTMSCSIPYSADGEYTVLVSAINRHGQSEAVSHSIQVIYGLPSVPQDVRHSTMRGRVSVSYSPPSSTGGLRVSRYRVELLHEGAVIRSSLNAANRRAATFTGLPAGEYQYRVSAMNARGWGDFSEFITVRVP